MPKDFEELKRELLQSDDEFRQLATLHHDLDERIHDLTTRNFLSEPEQVEEIRLKKHKLHLKDHGGLFRTRSRCRQGEWHRRHDVSHCPDTRLHENRSRGVSLYCGGACTRRGTGGQAQACARRLVCRPRRIPHVLLS